MNAQVEIKRFKLNLERYHQMIEAGILGSDDKLELIEGELFAMVPPGPEHADYVDYFDEMLKTCTTLKVRVRNPISLPDHSEPQPDIALVTRQRYHDHQPLPQDIKLIIEISDSSLDKDKRIKLPLYARYNIPEVWIVDVENHAIECYWEPRVGEYIQCSRLTTGLVFSATQSEVRIDPDALWDQK
jgi:Uma2 family endonuclease